MLKILSIDKSSFRDNWIDLDTSLELNRKGTKIVERALAMSTHLYGILQMDQ